MGYTCILYSNTFLVGRYWDFKHNGQWKIAENKVHTFFKLVYIPDCPLAIFTFFSHYSMLIVCYLPSYVGSSTLNKLLLLKWGGDYISSLIYSVEII